MVVQMVEALNEENGESFGMILPRRLLKNGPGFIICPQHIPFMHTSTHFKKMCFSLYVHKCVTCRAVASTFEVVRSMVKNHAPEKEIVLWQNKGECIEVDHLPTLTLDLTAQNSRKWQL